MRFLAVAALVLLFLPAASSAARAGGGASKTTTISPDPIDPMDNPPPALPGWFAGRRRGSAPINNYHSSTGLDGLDHETVLPDEYIEDVSKVKNVLDPKKDHYHDHDMQSFGSHTFSCKEY